MELIKINNHNLFDLDDYSKDDIMQVVSITERLKHGDIKHTLRNKTICTLFYENSTRTKISFELAAKRLGADVIHFNEQGSSVEKGESFKDTIQTLSAMGVDLFVVRHKQFGAPELVHEYSGIPVINAGCGSWSHPTQALLDIYTIYENFGRIEDLNITIVGDILNSRVVRSNLIGLSKMGANITLCAPDILMPKELGTQFNCRMEPELKCALSKADVVMTLRMQFERNDIQNFPSTDDYVRDYRLSTDNMKFARKHAIVMHPGPINRDIEITSELADDFIQSMILRQVTNGVYVRMTLLQSILA